MNKILFFVITIFLFYSCGTGYKILTHSDNEGCHIVHRMKSNNASAEKQSLGMYGQIWIDGEVYKSTGVEPSYYSLTVSCLTTPGLSIQNDSSLTISFKDLNKVLSGMSSRYKSEEVKMAGSIYLLEKCTFQIDKELLKKIGDSNSVNFSLKGKDRILNGKIPKTSIKRFKVFYYDYVNKEKTAT